MLFHIGHMSVSFEQDVNLTCAETKKKHEKPLHIICFHLERGREGRKKGGQDRGVTEAAAGDRWSERMNRDPDSHAQLSAGSKKERLTPSQTGREGEG